MKQYILIALAVLAGKYVDVPPWMMIFSAVSIIWAARELKMAEWKWN